MQVERGGLTCLRMGSSLHLRLDVDQMRACLAVWRQAVMFRRGYRRGDEAAERQQLLDKINRSLEGWLDMLRLCSTSPTDAERLGQVVDEIVAFRDWASEATLALALLVDAERASARTHRRTGRTLKEQHAADGSSA
jgi:hypothetical protein